MECHLQGPYEGMSFMLVNLLVSFHYDDQILEKENLINERNFWLKIYVFIHGLSTLLFSPVQSHNMMKNDILGSTFVHPIVN